MKIKAINIKSGEARYFDTIKEASIQLDVCSHTITDILRGFCYTHVKGWTFEYVEPEKAYPVNNTRRWDEEGMNPILVKQRVHCGAEFRNFQTVMQVLGFYADIKSGKKRANYQRKFAKYFTWRTEGHKVIITEVLFSEDELEAEIKKLEGSDNSE